MAFRIDSGTLRPAKRTPTGLRADAHITRCGVFSYRNPDGTTRLELREDSEVQNPESLASFAGVPVTDDHPPQAVDTENARTYARGATGENVRADGDKVATSITVFDASLIDRMERLQKSGRGAQVSCGYTCDLDETPGVHPRYGRYDAVQRNIRGNHVAIVDAGRAGPEVRVRMDGAAVMIDSDRDHAFQDSPTHRQDHAMDFEKLYKEAEQRAATEKARADKLEAERDAAAKRADTAEAQRDSEKQRADAAEKARKDVADGTPARVAARVALLTTAATVLRTDGKPDDLTAKSDREIKVAFVERVDGVKIATEKSDDYVDAYFESAVKRADKAASGMSGANRAANSGAGKEERSDAVDRETAARNKMIADNAARAATGAN